MCNMRCLLAPTVENLTRNFLLKQLYVQGMKSLNSLIQFYHGFTKSQIKSGNAAKQSWQWVTFLADRTNGRAIATLLRLSSSVVVVCDVMYCG